MCVRVCSPRLTARAPPHWEDLIAAGNVFSALSAPDRGTPVGAPLWDFEGKLRDDTPDVGAIED